MESKRQTFNKRGNRPRPPPHKGSSTNSVGINERPSSSSVKQTGVGWSTHQATILRRTHYNNLYRKIFKCKPDPSVYSLTKGDYWDEGESAASDSTEAEARPPDASQPLCHLTSPADPVPEVAKESINKVAEIQKISVSSSSGQHRSAEAKLVDFETDSTMENVAGEKVTSGTMSNLTENKTTQDVAESSGIKNVTETTGIKSCVMSAGLAPDAQNASKTAPPDINDTSRQKVSSNVAHYSPIASKTWDCSVSKDQTFGTIRHRTSYYNSGSSYNGVRPIWQSGSGRNGSYSRQYGAGRGGNSRQGAWPPGQAMVGREGSIHQEVKTIEKGQEPVVSKMASCSIAGMAVSISSADVKCQHSNVISNTLIPVDAHEEQKRQCSPKCPISASGPNEGQKADLSLNFIGSVKISQVMNVNPAETSITIQVDTEEDLDTVRKILSQPSTSQTSLKLLGPKSELRLECPLESMLFEDMTQKISPDDRKTTNDIIDADLVDLMDFSDNDAQALPPEPLTSSSSLPVESPADVSLPVVRNLFDSHCHLDRIFNKWRRSLIDAPRKQLQNRSRGLKTDATRDQKIDADATRDRKDDAPLDQKGDSKCCDAQSDATRDKKDDATCDRKLVVTQDPLTLMKKDSLFQLKKYFPEAFPPAFEGCITVYCDPNYWKDEKWIWQTKEPNVWLTFGCHPNLANRYTQATEPLLRKALENPKVVAVGEIGLDSFCDVRREAQEIAFRRQLVIAKEMNKSVCLHVRGNPECVKLARNILKELLPPDWPIHMHCFTDDWRSGELWMKDWPGMIFGVTPHKFRLDFLRKIPLEKLILETDSPYFIPKELADKYEFSLPGFVHNVALNVAKIKNVPYEQVLQVSRDNVTKIYKIPLEH